MSAAISPNGWTRKASRIFAARHFTRRRREVGGTVAEGRVSPNNERWHQTMKNRILLENAYLPGELKQRIEAFVANYNHIRAHESLQNLTPADVYFGRGEAILAERQRIKRMTIANRRLQHQPHAA
jgi:transposase InsO family protein